MAYKIDYGGFAQVRLSHKPLTLMTPPWPETGPWPVEKSLFGKFMLDVHFGTESLKFPKVIPPKLTQESTLELVLEPNEAFLYPIPRKVAPHQAMVDWKVAVDAPRSLEMVPIMGENLHL